jgi:hypothetical protein
MKILNRQETEDLVRDLYFNQKKTFREIQKIVRKSPRDIKSIIDKANPDKSFSFSVSSQAYRMFKDGSHPTDVAIALNLRQKEVSAYYREYWDLNGMYSLTQIYDETKDDIWAILELYKKMKAAGMNVAHAIRLLKITSNDIPSIEGKITELERKEADLNYRNSQAAKIFQKFNDNILKEEKILDQCRLDVGQLRQEIYKLNIEKIKLENTTNYFQNLNQYCINFTLGYANLQ